MERAQPHQIFIHVIEARGISVVEKSGMNDVQVNVTVGPTTRIKRTTRTKFQTSNAVWNEMYTFENVMLTEDEWKREKVSVSCVDRNDFTRNQFIGGVEFSLTNIYRQKSHEYHRKWTPLVHPDEPGKDHGHIQVSVYVLKKGDTTPSHGAGAEADFLNEKQPILRAPSDEPSLYLLNILLYRGEDLLATHGKSLNPFVSVRFNGATMQTKRMANIRNPIWNRKIVMPFQLPLHSDSIEIQVWNDNTMAPDTLIGQKTFSYYAERIQNRPFGPAWINLYSSHYVPPKTTFLGRMMSILDRTQYIGEDEYVGRILARLSVKRAKLNPRLRIIPCPPAVEPNGVEYALDFFVHAASEIPVQGGKVFVEVVFGNERSGCTKEVIAERPGEYVWNECFRDINAFGPENTDQVHDVIINVYHKAGYSSRKIAFERIPVRELLSANPNERRAYCVDGEPFRNNSMPPPKWRSLQNITYDEKRPHIIAGFLLCNIGFGIKRYVPKSLPRTIAKPKIRSYTLRVYVHQGINLPAASDDGSVNPFVLVRFAGRNRLVECPPRPTRYPYYYTMVEIDAAVDPEHVPNVILMVYHRTTTGGQQLMGRCEIQSRDIVPPSDLARAKFGARTSPIVTKYPLKVVNELGVDETSVPGDMRPSVVAQVQLLERRKDRPEVLPGWEQKEPGLYKKDNPLALRPPGGGPAASGSLMSPFSLKFECVGLRKMLGTGWERISNANLRIGLPPCLEVKEEKVDLDMEDGGTARVMKALFFEKVPVPSYSLSTTPLVVSLYDGDRLVSASYTPLSRFAGTKMRDIPTYRSAYDEKTGRSRDVTSIQDAISQVQQDELYRRRMREAARAVEEKKEIKEKREDDGKVQLSEVAGLCLGENCNVYELAKLGLRGQEQSLESGENEIKEVEGKEFVANELELRPEFLEKNDPFHHEFVLYRGRTIGLGASKIQQKLLLGDAKQSSNPQDELGAVKGFVQIAPLEEGKRGDYKVSRLIMHTKLMTPYSKFLARQYVCRVYVYRACNLSPRAHVMSNSVNPYVRITNGPDDENNFSSKKNSQKREQNPGFYQVVEIQVKSLSDNGTLSIEIWDDNPIMDTLIGSTQIDLEQRMLHGYDRGVKEYRRLLNPKYSTSQGLVLVKVDILTAEEARTTKPEELVPPQFLDYELRLVLWATQAVKFPQLEKRGVEVDQKVMVTANFDGDAGEEVVKETDTAWYSVNGNADWNWRMNFKLQLPCKNPRIKISVWDRNFILGTNEIMGEVVLNLQPFFARCLREKAPVTRELSQIAEFEHPNFRSKNLGNIKYELRMYTKVCAEENPAGEAQNEPNRDPYLPNPKRNAPPWAVGTRGLEWLASRQKIIVILIVAVLLLALFLPILLISLQSSS